MPSRRWSGFPPGATWAGYLSCDGAGLLEGITTMQTTKIPETEGGVRLEWRAAALAPIQA